MIRKAVAKRFLRLFMDSITMPNTSSIWWAINGTDRLRNCGNGRSCCGLRDTKNPNNWDRSRGEFLTMLCNLINVLCCYMRLRAREKWWVFLVMVVQVNVKIVFSLSPLTHVDDLFRVRHHLHTQPSTISGSSWSCCCYFVCNNSKILMEKYRTWRRPSVSFTDVSQ